MSWTPAEINPVTDRRWAELARGPSGSLFTSPLWLQVLARSYDLVPRATVLARDGALVGGVAWVDVEDLKGVRRVALPFCDRADPMVGEGSWPAILDAVVPADQPFTVRYLDSAGVADDERLHRVGALAWHATEVHAGTDATRRAALRPAARRNLDASVRRGVTVRCRTDLAAVETFHRLHVGLRKQKYRLLAQPRLMFEHMWDAFADGQLVTALAEYDGEVIAGAVYLEWNGVLYYKFGASDPASLTLRPNEAITWAALRWAAERGCHRLDWGVSDLDQPGLIRYKQKWADDEGTVVVARHDGPPPSAAQTQASAMLGRLTELLTRPAVPDDITVAAGELLYRHFC